jgi:hypothetical protein
MKTIISIIFTLFSISAVSQVGDSQRQRIEIQEIKLDGNLKIDEGLLIIRSKKEFKKIFFTSPSIYINFDKYTLIGVCKKDVESCRMPCYEYNYYKENDTNFLDMKVSKYGFCENIRHFYWLKWFLVPKLYDDEMVTLNIKFDGYCVSPVIIELQDSSIDCNKFRTNDELFVIRTEQEFKDVFKCSSSTAIDFDKYSIIVLVEALPVYGSYNSNSEKPRIRYNYYKENNDYIFNARIIASSIFQWQSDKIYVYKWFFLVTKLANDKVIFFNIDIIEG